MAFSERCSRFWSRTGTWFRERCLPFLCLLKVEPYMFLFMFAFMIKSVTVNQMYQDKICRFELKKDAEFCFNLNTPDYAFAPEKIIILGKASTYQLWQTIIQFLPGAALSMFVGSWSDKHLIGRKLLMIIGGLGMTLETFFLMISALNFSSSADITLLSFIPTALSGGFVCAYSAAYSHVSKYTPVDIRSIRYTVLEVCYHLASPSGSLLGGYILELSPMGGEAVLRNYVGVFIISLISSSLAVIWVMVVINERKGDADTVDLVARKLTELEADMSLRKLSEVDLKDRSSSQEGTIVEKEEEEETKWYNTIRTMFDLENVKSMFRTCSIERPDKSRRQIWLMLISICFVLLCYIGSGSILFQYTEKAFGWGAKKYSTVNAVGSVLTTIGMMISVPLFVKVLKVQDTVLGIIGISANFAQNVFRGTFQTEGGFFFAYFLGCFSGLASIATRTRLSKLVSKDELGTVFALMATLESLTPVIATVFFATLFRSTIHFYPGLAFQCAALTLFFPFGVFIWMDLFCLT